VNSLTMLAAIAAAFVVAGFVKGMIGLGLPTVGIGLLGLVMTPAQAAAILIVPSLVTNVWQCLGGGLVALTRRLWPLLAGICLGTLLGVLWLPSGGSAQAPVWLGTALVVYAALGLFKVNLTVPARAETGIGLLAGVMTGIITVATGVFVLPAVPYINALHIERDRLVQALGLSFTASTITLAIALSHAGEIGTSVIGPSLAGLVAAILGMGLGQIVRGMVKPETFRVVFCLGLLALGVHLALSGLM
jgi:uncharacterized membrane protein YfcA